MAWSETISDVIVVGGGLVGAAIACGLANAGAAVMVVDEGDVAYRASRGNFGLTWIQGKGEGFPAYARLSRDAAALWPSFAESLGYATGIDTGFRQPGGFVLCLSEDELEARRGLIVRMHNQRPEERYPVEMQSRNEVEARLPAIGDAVVGASYCPEDGQVSPLYLMRALHAAGQGAGVRYASGCPVERIDRDGGGFAVRVDGTTIRGTKVVLAAGLGNKRLAPQIGLVAPVRPVRGQVLVTHRMLRFLEHPTLLARQTDEGTVMLGDSHEEVGFDLGTTTPVIASIARRAILTFPCLAGAQLVRAWAALRVMPPDGVPIYEESEIVPGAFVVCCHSGVTLAPVHAERIAPAILDGSLNVRFASFAGSRFDDVQKAS